MNLFEEDDDFELKVESIMSTGMSVEEEKPLESNSEEENLFDVLV